MTDFKKEKDENVNERLITGQTFYIVQDGDFNTQEILLFNQL